MGSRKSTGIYSRANALAAINDHRKLNAGGFPLMTKKGHISKPIEGSNPLSAAKVSWKRLASKFNRNEIAGVPHDTNIGRFMRDEYEITDENLVIKVANPVGLGALEVFNSVAWHIIKEGVIPEADDSAIDYGVLKSNPIRLGSGQEECSSCVAFSDLESPFTSLWQERIGRIWGKLDELMLQGLVDKIPANVSLETFSKQIQKRILEKNFMPLNNFELRMLEYN